MKLTLYLSLLLLFCLSAVGSTITHDIGTSDRLFALESVVPSSVPTAPILHGSLLASTINGRCACADSGELTTDRRADTFAGDPIGEYRIGNVHHYTPFVLSLANLDPQYIDLQSNRPYYQFYEPDNTGIFTLYPDGTAHAVARVVNIFGDGFLYDFTYRGNTEIPPSGQNAVCLVAGCPNSADWTFYEELIGTLTGLPETRYAGSVISVQLSSAAAQIGTNAHIYSPQPYYGGAARLTFRIIHQPTTGIVLQSERVEGLHNFTLTALSDGATIGLQATNAEIAVPEIDTDMVFNKTEGIVKFVGEANNRWTYHVEGFDLEQWELGIRDCRDHIVAYGPVNGYGSNVDTQFGFAGISWTLPDDFHSGEFSFTLDQSYPLGAINTLLHKNSKTGVNAIIGPICDSRPTDVNDCEMGQAAALLTHYSLVTLDDFWTTGHVDGQLFVGGSLISQEQASFDTLSGTAHADPVIIIVGDLSPGDLLTIETGDLHLGGSTNGRPLQFGNDGLLVQDVTLRGREMTNVMQTMSAQLATIPTNSMVELPHGEAGIARFIVGANAEVAIFQIAATQLFANPLIEQIELMPGHATTILVNVTGEVVELGGGIPLAEHFAEAARKGQVLWNFSQAKTIYLGDEAFVGTLLAPNAQIHTSGPIAGTVVARTLFTTSDILHQAFVGDLSALCLATKSTGQARYRNSQGENSFDVEAEGEACSIAWLAQGVE